MKLQEIIGGEYAFVAKVDVSNLANSVSWYESKLGLVHDPRYDTPAWAQLNVPGIPQLAIGLNLGSPVGTGGAVSTFVVLDINIARNGLIANGVPVGPIIDVGHGVLLAFFKDPDGNSLGLRQNPAGYPSPSHVGKTP